MAQKQYAFDFVLNAVLNGGFTGTFTKAQQEFIRLGNEIKNLQAIQKDIASYQKQAAAVDNTTAKLNNLRRQYELVNRQITETTGSTTALEREKLRLEQRIQSTEAALEKQRAKLDSTKERLDAAGVSTDNLSAKDAELTERIKELAEEQKNATESVENFGGTGTAAIEAVAGAITSAGIAEAMVKIKDAFVECVETAADFGQAMSAVEAIANASGTEMAALTAEAKELGANTIYTAQESAKGMEYMAMAGWDASEMLAGMSGMTTLAAAAGEDLGQVSDIVTDNLSAFGMKASETAHFADVLAAAAANSNTNISIMGETFKNSSSVAGALGYSIEDVAMMVGLMANNAVKGSRAGTALRNIFNGLLGGVTLTAKAFGEAEYSAVNYDGSMKGLMETVEDLRGYFGQMSEAEKVNNAMAIAGMRGYNGLLAIINATDEDFQNLYNSIYNCTGAAERMAAVKLDNLNGDLTLMDSAMEALESTIGEQFNPELRELTQAGTEGINWINEFIKENPAFVKGLMAGTGAFMTMGTAIVGVNAAIKIFKALNVASLFTGKAGVLLAVAAGIAAVTAGVVSMVDAMRDGGPAVRELTEAALEMEAAMVGEKETLEDAMASTIASADVANLYIDRLEEMGDVTKLSNDEQKQYQNTLAMLLEIMPSLADQISVTTDEYGRSIYKLNTSTDALRKNTEEWKENAKAQAYHDYLTSMMEKYNDVMVEAAENEVKLALAQDDLSKLQGKYGENRKRIIALEQEASEKAEQQYKQYGVVAEATDFLSQEYYDLIDAQRDLEREMENAQIEVKNHEKAIEKDGNVIEEASKAIEYAQVVYDRLTDAMGDNADLQDVLSGLQIKVRMALDGTLESMQELDETYTKVYESAKESFFGQFALFDEAAADTEATVAAAQEALDTQLSYWQSYASNIAALKEVSAEDLGVTQENYEALMEYVRSGTPEAAGLAADMVRKINEGNTEALGNLATTLGEISEKQDEAAEEVADWTAGLSEQLDQLLLDVEEDVKGLNMGEEAASAAQDTIQSYIDKANDMLPQVREAYASLAQAAKNAISPKVYLPGSAFAVQYSGYASGTDNAPPGWAWVGEEGPELMRMHGGEQILPSAVSKGLAESYSLYRQYATASGVQQESRAVEVIGGSSATISGAKIEMNFHIGAGASPETVGAWQNYARRGELKETILEVMEEVNADTRRRVMV